MEIAQHTLSRFEWDLEKRLENIEKHGIDFPVAANALMQPHAEKRSDQNGEVRILAICPLTNRLIAIIYTMRGDVCRIISARAARKNEREEYRQLFLG